MATLRHGHPASVACSEMGAGATVRPRLLVASLLIAAVVGIGGGLWWGTRSDDDTADATLNDASSVGEPLPDVEVLDVDGETGVDGRSRGPAPRRQPLVRRVRTVPS
ncbi:MAG: hypothetical protein WKF58_07215 [Ilumatobacteraceae bacterium]